MTRFMIEVPHENKKEACERAVRVFLETGSHFMTNADWGCKDDEHKAWIVVDLDSKEEAMAILPPLFRHDAKIGSGYILTDDAPNGILFPKTGDQEEQHYDPDCNHASLHEMQQHQDCQEWYRLQRRSEVPLPRL